MSRWFIEDYSEEELTESLDEFLELEEQIMIDEDDKPHKVPEEITLDYFIPQPDPNNEIKNRDQTSNKQYKIDECRNLLDNILQNINDNQIKKSYDEFSKLQAVYKQLQKEFKKSHVPNFFINKLFEINQKINEQLKSNKQVRLFQKDLKKFNRNFEKELAEYEKHPDNFKDEIDSNEMKKSDEDFDISSSDEEQIAKDENDGKVSPQDANSKIEEKVVPENLNDDESIKAALLKYIYTKSNISMRMDIDYLFTFYKNVVDKKIERRIQLEICDVVMHLPNWQKIPFKNISKILQFLPDLVSYAKFLVPFFGRLNQDLLFYSSKLYGRPVQNSIHFYQVIHKFVNIMNNFKQKLLEDNQFQSYVRLENIFMEYLYSNEKFDLSPYALNMYNSLDKNIFSKSVTENYISHTSLLYSFNLALRKNVQTSMEILNKVQSFDSQFFSNSKNQFLYVRALIQIGFSAFDECLFATAYNCFSKLINMNLLDENNLSKTSTYPQLPSIERSSIYVRYIFSTIMVNLPFIVTGINDESDDSNKNKEIKMADKRATNFIDKFNSDEKQILSSKYLILSNLINYAKIGDWKNAHSLLLSNFGNILSNRNKFAIVVQKIFLCSFLKSYSNASIKINSLETKFKLDKNSILEIVNNMISGVGPIENDSIHFNGQLSEDKKTILIHYD